MTKRTMTALVALFGSALVPGCNGSGPTAAAPKTKAQQPVPAATITPENQADLYPMKEGNTWTYKASSTQTAPDGSRSSEAEITFRIKSVKDTADGKQANVEVSSDGTVTDHVNWMIDSKGISQVSAEIRDSKANTVKSVSYEPPSPVVPFPVTPGQFSEMDGVGPRPAAGSGPYHQTLNVLGVQEVDTESGRMSALGVETVMTYANKDLKFTTTATTFWAPKVGLVRYIQEIVATSNDGRQISQTSILRLKSHQP
ncbi:MAG: hypothetical protein JSS66_09985 [Armatimonadetes bacterium]|nr:hypothetical protein [Armatimonadota bacterium]